MVVVLNTTGNPISRQERVKINENWDTIIALFTNLQNQLNAISSVPDIAQLLADLQAIAALLPDVQQSIDNANTATASANTATTNANTATSNADAKIVEMNAALITLQTAVNNAISATTSANEAAGAANEAVNQWNLVKDDVNNAVLAISGWVQTGLWNASKSYVKNNLVTYNGSSWQAKRNNANVTPAENTDWLLFAKAGTDGVGAVSKVNGVGPNSEGNVEITTTEIEDSKTGLKLNTVLDGMELVNIPVSLYGVDKTSNAINLALNVAKNNGGGRVLIPPGTYLINDILKIPSNTHLIGVGEVILKRNADLTAILINDSDGTKGGYNANENMHVYNITFDANNTAFTANTTSISFGHANNIVVDNCEFLNCTTWHDFELNSSRNVLVENCRFPNYKGTSEALQIDYAGFAGAFPWFGPYDDTACVNIVISRCEFVKTAYNDTNDADKAIKAIGNHSFKAGVKINNVKIYHCVFRNFYHTIDLQDVDNLTIDDCKFIQCNTAVVFQERENGVVDWKITYNHFKFNKPAIPKEGRFFYGKTTAPTKGGLYNIDILNNYIDSAEWNAIGCTASAMKIRGNEIVNAEGRGIYIYGGSNIVIADNTIYGTVQHPDIVLGNNPAVSAFNTITSNNVVDKIYTFTNVDRAVITNNVVNTSIVHEDTGGIYTKNNLVAGAWVL